MILYIFLNLNCFINKPRSCLNKTNILIRYGHGWNLEYRLQMLERIGPVRQMQSGFDRPVYIYDIVAEDTLDEAVIARTAGKAAVQDALLSYMKRRTHES